MDRLLRACVNSWKGLVFVAKTETAFQQELAVFAVAVPLAFVVAADPWKRLLLIGAIVLLMVVELLNTAIEKLADRVSREIDPQIGIVKDMGSAAVGVTMLIAAAVWLLGFWEWLAAT
jgi:diacylglycerol kinase (ATP)